MRVARRKLWWHHCCAAQTPSRLAVTGSEHSTAYGSLVFWVLKHGQELCLICPNRVELFVSVIVSTR